MNLKQLFESLYFAETEAAVNQIIEDNPEVFKGANWKAIGGNESNFGIIENQQSNPIAALVEKVTNSMDAMLMKRCHQLGIDPKGKQAPKSMEEAVELFFPEYKNWDLPKFRRTQSEQIQVLADGPTKDTAVIIYDDGEGQNPEDFENTFLSLVRGNKNDIMFVQGKYNMGGSGAIVFCGKKSYQLIGSKRFDGNGRFGFTLVREHPFAKGEESYKKNTWYEYLKIDGQIPSFDCGDMDLQLHNRLFKTGTVIKLYSYQFPSGYSGFAQDLNQSLNEFLFEPVLPILTVDKKKRYPNNKVLELDLFGLKRRIEQETNYVEEWFSEEYLEPNLFGKMKVSCYAFRAKQADKSVKDTKDDIKKRYFKNNMSVMFSMNGQVHGHLTSEFITRTLKFNLLKDYLLIHVDCTDMNYNFRKELFMASRDRLKQGEESNALREYLGKKLRKSQLDEINKRRKDSIGFESEDTTELVRSFAKNMPKDSNLFKLLQNTLKLEEKKDKKEKQEDKRPTKQETKEPFNPKRFPSLFKLHSKKDNPVTVISIPKGGEKVIKFDTDVENHYFDRTEENGELTIGILDVKHNSNSGGDRAGNENAIGKLLSVTKSSPKDGTIKLGITPSNDLNVGDEIQLQVTLTGPTPDLQELIWVKIVEPEAPKENTPKEDTNSIENLGLPKLTTLYEKDWEACEQRGISMGYDKVMYPVGEGDKLEEICVNLDSNVYLNHRSKLKSESQIEISQKKYIASIYFHTLFLYMVTKRKNYKMTTMVDGSENDVTVDEYIKDVFDSSYSDFLLNFGMEQLIGALED